MTTPTPEKLTSPPTPYLNGQPAHGQNGHNGHNGRNHQPGQPGSNSPEAFPPPTRRNSFWPFLVDVGIVTMLVSWIILKIGPLIVVGGFVAVVALVGWFRDARADFKNLSDG
jgi:hypothetical protein